MLATVGGAVLCAPPGGETWLVKGLLGKNTGATSSVLTLNLDPVGAGALFTIREFLVAINGEVNVPGMPLVLEAGDQLIVYSSNGMVRLAAFGSKLAA